MTQYHRQIYSFLGLPASGKGTQVDRLAADRHLEIIGIGDLIRTALEHGDQRDPFFAQMKRRYEAGIPQPDDIVIDLVRSALASSQKDIIFDNFPFNTNQARNLDRLIFGLGWSKPIIIYLKVMPESVINRVINRRICANCGKVYISDQSDLCQECGGNLIVRPDDTEDVIRERIARYLPSIKEIIEHYGPEGRVIEIDGEPGIEEVAKSIKEALNQFDEKQQFHFK